MKHIFLLLLVVGVFVTFSTSLSINNVQLHRAKRNLNELISGDSAKACSICKTVVSFLHGFGSAQLGEKLLVEFSDFICDKFKLSSHRICQSIIPEFKHVVWGVFFDAIVEPNELCGWLVGNNCAHTTAYFASWNVTLPDRDEESIRPEQSELYQEVGVPLRILQLTDTHLDEDYLEGTLADCGEPLCCRKEDPIAGKGQLPAPKYGYQGYCDTNTLLFNTMLKGIAKNHSEVKYIYWTGDIPAHNVWNQSKDAQVKAIKYATKTLLQYFPHMKIFPTLGNHEGFPVNNFPPNFISGADSGQWLRSALADDWLTWLPEDTKETILRGGFYTTLVEKGLRVISLNMNYGNSGNWWLWVKSRDPAGQLQWFADVLYKAEKAGEKVHVIGHIPPDHCLKWFTYNYYRIVTRFYDTITGQFFGHTHHDELRIYNDVQTFQKILDVSYIAPSVTTYHALNPGYRIYSVDGQQGAGTYHVVNYDTYYANLTKANEEGNLYFELEYNAKDLYGLPSLSPTDWHKLLYRFMDDDELFQKFYKAYYKQFKTDRCVGECKKSFVCTMLDGLGAGFHNFCNFQSPKQVSSYLNWRKETYNKC